jgi:hypothetical protein
VQVQRPLAQTLQLLVTGLLELQHLAQDPVGAGAIGVEARRLPSLQLGWSELEGLAMAH